MYIIYGKPNCQYCDKAKNLLDSKKLEYKYTEIGLAFDVEDLRNLCARYSVVPKQVPQIFKEVAGELKYIGGFDKLQEEV